MNPFTGILRHFVTHNNPPTPTIIPAAAEPPKQETKMAFSFKSVGHFFAKAYTAIVAELPKIEATATTVEKVSSAIPVYGPLAVTAEQAAYAVLGELSAVLTAGGAAAEAKLADAGLDINVINTVKEVVASVPNIVAVAKSL